MGLGLNSFKLLHGDIFCYCATRHLSEKDEYGSFVIQSSRLFNDLLN